MRYESAYRNGKALEKEQCKIEVYTYICNQIQKSNRTPSVEEICDKLCLSKNRVQGYLREMNGSNDVFGYEDGRIYSIKKRMHDNMLTAYPFLQTGMDNYHLFYEKMLGHGDRYFTVANGDGMSEAGIHDGNHVIVDLWRMPRDGQQAMVLLNGKKYMRTVRHHQNGRIYLVREMKEPEITEIGKDDDCRILGVVWKVIGPGNMSVREVS